MTEAGSWKAQREHVDWSVPPGRADWLFGVGATRTEQGLVWAAVAVGALAVSGLATHAGVAWTWWQWLVVLLVVLDVVGGVPANALGSAKRWYAREPEPGGGLAQRLALDHVLFTAAHVHLFVVTAVLPEAHGAHWGWATYWYAVALGSVVLVRRLPVHLQRPVALALTAVALIVGEGLLGPAGISWLGPVLLLKLLVAHAVTEAPFRPLSGVNTLSGPGGTVGRCSPGSPP